MHGVPPFVVAQILTASALGAVAGAHVGVGTALLGAVLMFGGSAISVVISCFIWPDQDEPGWKLALVATFANPLLLFALLVMGLGWDCIVHLGGDLFACFAPFIAAWVAILCLLSIFAGWTWHWWKRRGAASFS
jgi:hypothetical protein